MTRKKYLVSGVLNALALEVFLTGMTIKRFVSFAAALPSVLSVQVMIGECAHSCLYFGAVRFFRQSIQLKMFSLSVNVSGIVNLLDRLQI